MPDFSVQVLEACEKKNSLVVVGLDPAYERLPAHLRQRPGPQAIGAFCQAIINAVAEVAVAVKPQIAFFERWGAAGLAALEVVCREAKRHGLLVILDAKRGDIASTAEAYAQAYLRPENLGACIDAITLNPYLGSDSLEPFVRAARASGKCLFVLVRTSNPAAAEMQELSLKGGPALYERVAQLVRGLAAQAESGCRYPLVGAVVGATAPPQTRRVRQILDHHWLLLPGYGAQGAGALDAAAGLDENGGGLLVNASRSILYAYESEAWERAGDTHSFAEAARWAAERMRDELRQVAQSPRPVA